LLNNWKAARHNSIALTILNPVVGRIDPIHLDDR